MQIKTEVYMLSNIVTKEYFKVSFRRKQLILTFNVKKPLLCPYSTKISSYMKVNRGKSSYKEETQQKKKQGFQSTK